ncbi:poly-beta-1,6-N-acetyl-D-glucosamine N-deacetylase PgaB [Klebsiella quasipneumoniae]|uniref:poly-beta-1,6-N-acetyl-D-glucosamine N-deacetylase PgaB n=1 Tax=Klebsiella quasipneumoniae TaxID=1463165 RepID=UPI00388E649F
MLNTTLRNGLMLLGWLCLIFSVRAEEVPFLAPQQRPQLEANKPWPADRFLVLAYHDVEDDAADQRYLSVRTSALNEQIAWLLHHGYHAVSVQDILDAHHGLKSLPPKAFLLSFDDGYSSFYTRVWPLLKAWNVPALWAPVGSWVDTPANQPVNFGGLMTPRAWVWPYGAASGSTLAIAKQQGYQLAFTLNDGLGNVKDLDNIPRMLIAGNPSIKAFANAVTQIQEADPVRVMHVDLDYVYDPNPVQQAKNIDKLIQRVYDMKISHVFLQAFSDPQGDGTVKSLYFPNRWLPMRADLFNFVSWQLQTRGGVKVYAWMPVLAFDLSSDLPRVQRWDPQTGKALLARQPYVRLSPWDPRVRQQITDIYEDLARHASFSGILFHDDAVLTDFEDVSPEAVAAWRQSGLAHDAGPVPHRPQEREAWMRFKSQTLTRFTLQLRQAVQAIRGPQVKTARNLFALPILEPQSEAWFAQNLDDFLAAYDWTVPMAMPLMESVPIDASQAWLTRLVQTVARHPGALKKTIFELQARDWSRRQHNAIPDQQLADWMRLLRLNGVKNYGYYPDDFINNQPDISRIRPQFSSWWYPDHD